MGVEYSIADHEHKRLFHLGKGPWSALEIGSGRRIRDFRDVAELSEALVRIVFDSQPVDTRYESFLRGTVAPELWKFLGDAPSPVLVDDFSSDCVDDPAYKTVGSRYPSQYQDGRFNDDV